MWDLKDKNLKPKQREIISTSLPLFLFNKIIPSICCRYYPPTICRLSTCGSFRPINQMDWPTQQSPEVQTFTFQFYPYENTLLQRRPSDWNCTCSVLSSALFNLGFSLLLRSPFSIAVVEISISTRLRHKQQVSLLLLQN